MIHLLHPSCVKLHKVALGRMLKSIGNKDKTLKETDPEKVELQQNSDQFKTMQKATMYFMHLLNISPCLILYNSVNCFFLLIFESIVYQGC